MNASRKDQLVIIRTLAIWLLAFTAGSFVMLTELIGARVLAPYFGNTIYVWGSVIGVFLLTMAIGYALGGRMTRRWPSPTMPALLAALAGVYVTATPLYQDALSAWLYFTGVHVKWAALFATFVLYGIPMALLGGVSPYCVHIATRSGSEVGISAGGLYAISTAGSFMGCLVTAFVLIPMLPISVLIVCSGIGMVIISLLVSLVLTGRNAAAWTTGVLAMVVVIVAASVYPGESWQGDKKAYEYPLEGRVLSEVSPDHLGPVLAEAQKEADAEAAKYAGHPAKTILETETPYHHMVILQDGPVRQLIFGKPGFKGAQNCMDLRDLSWHVSEYTHISFAGLLFRPLPKRVCVIGVGGAMVPRALELCIPGVEVDAVEIDPNVIRVAQDYFYWRPSKNVRVYTQDGRSFLNWAIINKRPPYDWVILDAYNDDSVPFHLTTREFMQVVQWMLTEDGIVVANMRSDQDLYGYEARTLEAIFGNVTPFMAHRSGNIILVAQNGRAKPLTIEEAAAAARKLSLPEESRIDLRYILSCLREDQNWSSDGPVLTDLWSPVETLID